MNTTGLQTLRGRSEIQGFTHVSECRMPVANESNMSGCSNAEDMGRFASGGPIFVSSTPLAGSQVPEGTDYYGRILWQVYAHVLSKVLE